MEKSNIILTGMPGSGKSTVGIILAKELCMDFIDTDVLIQVDKGMILQDIYDASGVERFLDIEEQYVMGLAVTDTVIAPGGSVILNDRVMSYLRQSGITVFLDVPIDSIKQRIDLYSRGTVREPGETLDDVWRKREPLYRVYADIVVKCGEMGQMEIAQYIAQKLRG